jgi:Rieske Fe-S protein
LAELQKDPVTRKDFLAFGVLGAITTAILTIPPAAFVLGPLIDIDVRGQSNIPDEWFEVGSIGSIPEGEPKYFRVNFPVEQVYSVEDVQKESGISKEEFVVESAVWVSWKTEILPNGRYGEVLRPSFLDEYDGGSLTEEQMTEAQESLNVLSSSCAHLGCPVRWITREGEGELLCPCHGGIYNINGEYVAGPPPRDLYRYTHEVREDGLIYIKHQYDIEEGLNMQEPYVV